MRTGHSAALVRLRIYLFACSALTLIGCGGVVYEYDPSTGSVKTHRFSTYDEKIYYSIDVPLSEEMQGRHPSAGTKTWREYWEWRISLWRKQNDQKYEDYFYRRRKEMGLKDLNRL